jgi:hypothetical protein
VSVAIIKRHTPERAATLLGALHGVRQRRGQAGTQAEIEGEVGYKASLRRQLGDGFDVLYARGQALDETAMISLAFAELDAISEATDALDE